MSANLLDGGTTDAADGTTYSDGVWSVPANDTSKEKNAVGVVLSGTEAVAENQTLHVGFSLRAADGASVSLLYGIGYVDGAGHRNWVMRTIVAKGTDGWQRVEGSLVMPSGMRVLSLFIHQGAGSAALELTAPCLSYGSPVTLASSAHTPYATQDHLRSEYATKAALKVTSDAVTAEVEERGKLAGKVGTLESTSGTHTSKLEQLASSIKSLVKGESTYTDPDGASATSGIYSLVTQTRDSVTALFGSYTKTEDLASTQAVKDAKKAGTDAQAAASNAQSTADGAVTAADTAQSTADAAKDAIDNLEIGGRNLYIRSTTVPGYLSAGATDNINSPSSVTKERTSDYISIDANSAYVLQSWFDDSDTSQYSWMCLHWYTDNKEPISEAAREHMQGLVYRKRLLTSPANAAYARISARFQEIDEWRQKIKFEKGNKSTDWTPAPEDTDSAVKDAKKAGTDAQAAASAAQTTADSASSTAGAAKSTADSLATMVRQYSGGVLVCKVGQQVGALVNADGSFDVADVTWDGETPTAGKKLMRLAKNSIEFNNPDTSYNICNITANGTLTNIYVPNGSLAIDETPAWCQAIGDSGYDSFIAGKMLQLGAGNRRTYSEILIEPDGTTINGYKFALGTNNTTDTWVPVMGGNSNAGHLVHRVINLKWGPNAYAVYGAYNPNNGGDHYYTTNVNEYNKLVKSGWTGSGVYFYAAL